MTDNPLQPYLDYLELERGMSPRTVEAYGRDVTGFLATAVAFGILDNPPDSSQWKKLDGQRSIIRGHLAVLRRQERRLTTLDRHLAGIRSFYRYLQTTGLVTSVPANLTAGKGGRERRLPRDLNLEMASRLMEMPTGATPIGRRDRRLPQPG